MEFTFSKKQTGLLAGAPLAREGPWMSQRPSSHCESLCPSVRCVRGRPPRGEAPTGARPAEKSGAARGEGWYSCSPAACGPRGFWPQLVLRGDWQTAGGGSPPRPPSNSVQSRSVLAYLSALSLRPSSPRRGICRNSPCLFLGAVPYRVTEASQCETSGSCVP